nr:immunoglobulin heavy chain junction region [Macaca mulatta]
CAGSHSGSWYNWYFNFW